jgi:hypothetical protein
LIDEEVTDENYPESTILERLRYDVNLSSDRVMDETLPRKNVLMRTRFVFPSIMVSGLLVPQSVVFEGSPVMASVIDYPPL